ncbi:MAG: pyridoxal phosphate-dependent aminotransferase [Planctomycetota bacterium]
MKANAMSLSRLARDIHASSTLQLNQQANALRKEGQPVIHLGAGEPESLVPVSATEAAVACANTREVRYTPAAGTAELRQAIADYTGEYYGYECSTRNVIVSHGAKQAIYCAMQAIVDPGEEVIFPAPYWVSYPDMVRMIGGIPVPVVPASHPFQPSIADIEAKVSDRTKAVLINSPNNPTGAIYEEQFVADITRFCEERGLYLITDDIYQRLVFDGRKPPNPLDFAKIRGDESRVVVVNGVSKQYAMTGYRIGWAVAAEPIIKVMSRLQSHQTSGASIITQNAAAAALKGSQDDVYALRSNLESKRHVLVDALAKVPGVSLTPPEGTFYGFADFSYWDEDCTRLCKWLLDRVMVVTVPGVEFGLSGYLRISFCDTPDNIRNGVERIRWALDAGGGSTLEQNGHTFTRDWDDQPQPRATEATPAGADGSDT